MLIGLSFRNNKNTDKIAKIIQGIDWYYNNDKNLQKRHPDILTWMNGCLEGTYQQYSNWKIKSITDKLREISSILLGCTKKDLQNTEFLSKLVDPDWWHLNVQGEIRNRKIPYTSEEKYAFKRKNYKTIRYNYLAIINMIRNSLAEIHPNFWINALFSDYQPTHLSEGWVPSYYDPDNIDCKPPAEGIYPDWIIKDCNFNAIQKEVFRRGIIISDKIFRDKDEYYYLNTEDNMSFLIQNITQILKKENIIV